MENVRWLGFEWDDRLSTPPIISASCTSGRCRLIREGKAYVCDLTAEEVRKTRGTLTEPGKESPYRNRPVEENLDLFQRMKTASFPMARAPCAPRWTWPRPISTCATR